MFPFNCTFATNIDEFASNGKRYKLSQYTNHSVSKHVLWISFIYHLSNEFVFVYVPLSKEYDILNSDATDCNDCENGINIVIN